MHFVENLLFTLFGISPGKIAPLDPLEASFFPLWPYQCTYVCTVLILILYLKEGMTYDIIKPHVFQSQDCLVQLHIIRLSSGDLFSRASSDCF